MIRGENNFPESNLQFNAINVLYFFSRKPYKMIDERGNIFFKNNNSEMMVLEEKIFRATDRCSRQAF